ncbi:MAG TPA: PQQ-binding-like beta-propeller repeat protein [Thermoanaerobaculia bacterium]|nr:PQQ-binding-like beta-propeller repeat protein [Thermoanaerobaculia bacterium]
MRRAILGLAVFASMSLHAQTSFPAAGAEWTTYNGTIDSRRYSSLDQINATNVRRLRPAWIFQTGVTDTSKSFECTPLVVNDTMYVTAPDDSVTALDAATGDLKWTFKPKMLYPDGTEPPLCCGQVNRGAAYYRAAKPANDLLYVATLDARIYALNPSTGALATTFGDQGFVTVADYTKGYSETAAPVVWDGKIFIGIAGGEFRTRGFVSAYDAQSGKMLWRWYTIPAPGEPGGDSWPAGKYLEGGVAVWMNPTIDVKYRQILFATGNPNPDFDGSTRAGDNLYSCGVVAVDADTGKMRWAFQEVRHDLWDYDQTNTPILFTTNITGKPVDAAGAAGKTGWFYMLDRQTGKSIVPMKEIKVSVTGAPNVSPVQFVPDDGPPYHIKPFVPHNNMWTPPGVFSDAFVAPGLSGGAEWSPLSTSPKTNYIYVASIEKEMYFCRDPFPPKSGATAETQKIDPRLQIACAALAFYIDRQGMSVGGVAIVPPASQTATVVKGAFIAIDANTGNVVPNWRYETKPHPIGGTLATAGDLVFAGESNGFFDALDARTGKLLWQYRCGAGVNAAPMTYAVKDAKGKMHQYVAVAVGGLAGASLPNAQIGDPNAFRYFRSGDSVIVFALPDE